MEFNTCGHLKLPIDSTWKNKQNGAEIKKVGPTRVQPLDTCEDFCVGAASTWMRDSHGPGFPPHVSKVSTRVEGFWVIFAPLFLLCWYMQVLAKKKPHVSSALDTCESVFALLHSLSHSEKVSCFEDFDLEPLQWSYVHLKASGPRVRPCTAVHFLGGTSASLLSSQTTCFSYWKLIKEGSVTARSYRFIKTLQLKLQELWRPSFKGSLWELLIAVSGGIWGAKGIEEPSLQGRRRPL